MKKFLIFLSLLLLTSCNAGLFQKSASGEGKELQESHLSSLSANEVDWKSKDEKYWREVLTPLQYEVTREAGTERAFTGKYWDEKSDGIYICSNCGQHLFDAKTKYKSGTGWPSFWEVIEKNAVREVDDSSFGISRTEIICSRCDAHLGHIFPDGPKPTGKRYCMNSVSLILIPKDKKKN